jgi:hypothetical protein
VSAGHLEAGGHTIQLDVSARPAGMYIAELSLDGSASGSTRLVVLD